MPVTRVEGVRCAGVFLRGSVNTCASIDVGKLSPDRSLSERDAQTHLERLGGQTVGGLPEIAAVQVAGGFQEIDAIREIEAVNPQISCNFFAASI